MIAEIKPSVGKATNIFTTVVVSLLHINIGFCDTSYIILYPQPRSATARYTSFSYSIPKIYCRIDYKD